jgi:hypothetical protein
MLTGPAALGGIFGSVDGSILAPFPLAWVGALDTAVVVLLVI